MKPEPRWIRRTPEIAMTLMLLPCSMLVLWLIVVASHFARHGEATDAVVCVLLVPVPAGFGVLVASLAATMRRWRRDDDGDDERLRRRG